MRFVNLNGFKSLGDFGTMRLQTKNFETHSVFCDIFSKDNDFSSP